MSVRHIQFVKNTDKFLAVLQNNYPGFVLWFTSKEVTLFTALETFSFREGKVIAQPSHISMSTIIFSFQSAEDLRETYNEEAYRIVELLSLYLTTTGNSMAAMESIIT